MPFYMCIHKEGLLTDERKRAIALGITDIHCELTGAPRHFVHVMFQPYTTGNCYTGGQLSKVANIRGAIRAGRSQIIKEQMLQRMTDLWRSICPETDLSDVIVSLTENPGTNVMEGGVVLPHPVDDAAWLAENGFTAPSASRSS